MFWGGILKDQEEPVQISTSQNRSFPTSNFQSGRKDFDHAKYDELFKVVEKEILQLRVILQSIEARERERTWLRGKVLGESLGFKNGLRFGMVCCGGLVFFCWCSSSSKREALLFVMEGEFREFDAWCIRVI